LETSKEAPLSAETVPATTRASSLLAATSPETFAAVTAASPTTTDPVNFPSTSRTASLARVMEATVREVPTVEALAPTPATSAFETTTVLNVSLGVTVTSDPTTGP